jgi:excinuclease ABC subunit C
MLDFDCGQEFDPARDAEFFTTLPARPGILLIEMRDPKAQPYLARTADIRRAAERLLNAPEELSKRLNLREVACTLRYRTTGSKFEQILAHYHQARALFPTRYRELVRVRPPAMLKVNLRNQYPRCYVTRRIHSDHAFYFGPFSSRKAADAFGEAFLDLFKIRRCQIKIRRDPSFPGCIYSEMKMCLAPCFAGCTKQEYDAEVGRVLSTLETTGSALIEGIEREREAASQALDFEHAAGLHKRLEKASSVLRALPGLTRKIEDLNIVILQRAPDPTTIAAFPVRGGILKEPIFLRFGELSSEPRSVEAILRAGLEENEGENFQAATALYENLITEGGHAAATRSPAEAKRRFGLRATPYELSEHLSLIGRWFYSNPREGEILFREADWPYRRILRACARLLARPADSTQAPSSQQKAMLARERIKRLNAFSKQRRKPAK